MVPVCLRMPVCMLRSIWCGAVCNQLAYDQAYIDLSFVCAICAYLYQACNKMQCAGLYQACTDIACVCLICAYLLLPSKWWAVSASSASSTRNSKGAAVSAPMVAAIV